MKNNIHTQDTDRQEIDHFSKDAKEWWNEKGPFAPLHRMGPARLRYIKTQICTHFNRKYENMKAFEGLTFLDIGCGGGLVCEPMARLGAAVTGVDADPVAIETAINHAEQAGLDIKYINGAAEDLLSSFESPPQAGGNRREHDIVLALEIIEHVNDPAKFVETCAGLVKPGGLVIFSTLNRNLKSFALGIVAAEFILRWVPRGTHSWKKFIRPSELARWSRAAGLKPGDISGLVFDPLKNEFKISNTDIDVNYFLTAQKEQTE